MKQKIKINIKGYEKQGKDLEKEINDLLADGISLDDIAECMAELIDEQPKNKKSKTEYKGTTTHKNGVTTVTINKD